MPFDVYSQAGADAAFATAAQGAKADTAVQPADLTAYATDAELADGLATKAATSHTHATSDVTGLDAALTGKASTSHTHAIADTTGLQAALDAETAARVAGLGGKVAKGELTFNVKDYGAVGDGTTDDTAAIADALTAARTVTGEVLFPPGTYMVSAQLNPAGCKIRGYGATLKSVGGVVGFNMLQATSAGCSVFGLTIDHNKANTTDPVSSSQGIGIYVFLSAGGDCGNFVDVKVVNAWGAAVRIGSTVQTDSMNALNTRAEVRNLTADLCAYGVFISGGRDVTVIGGTLTNLTEVGVQDNNSLRTTISGVTVDTTTVSHGIVSQYGYGTRITGNHCSNTAFAGICIGGGQVAWPVARYFSITGNTCTTNYSHGITIDPTLVGSPGISQSVYGAISGNVCANNGLASGSGQGIYLHNAADVAVTGNVCRNNQSAGIAVDGLRCAVSGNTLVGNGVFGLEMRGIAGTDHGGHAIGVNAYSGNATDFYESSIQAVPNTIALTNQSAALGAVKAANSIRNNTTATTADSELTIPNVPAGTFAIEAFLIYDAALTADLRITWTLPVGATVLWTGGAMATSATTFASPIENRPTPSAFGLFGGVGVGTSLVARPLGTLTVTTAGAVTLEWAQGTADPTDTTLQAGSHISLRRIA